MNWEDLVSTIPHHIPSQSELSLWIVLTLFNLVSEICGLSFDQLFISPPIHVLNYLSVNFHMNDSNGEKIEVQQSL